MTTTTRTWACIPCGWGGNTGVFCAKCGRRREHATDAARWQRFFAVAETTVQPRLDFIEPEDCDHEEAHPEDTGTDRRFFVCDECGATVVLTEPDEDGQSYWEVPE